MSDKERIEAIKRKQIFETGSEKEFIRVNDIIWLIEQAERVEELEEENKRYREALEYVSNELDHAYTTGIYEQKDELIKESIVVIDKALEERT